MNEDHASRTYGLSEGEGEARWWMGGLATIKATGKETEGSYTLVEVLEPEGEQPFHVHHREDEGFWVLEGELTFSEVGEETIKASPGSFVFGPRDFPHRYTVDSGPAKLLFFALAWWLRGVHLRHQQAPGAHPAAPAGGPA